MIISEIQKNIREQLRVSIETYHGTVFVDLRVYWLDEQREWRPSRKGIAINGQSMSQVIQALGEARAKLDETKAARETGR